jgi:glycogen debranching enzyme
MTGGDLVALEYAAFRSYARLMEWRGNDRKASAFDARARELKARYNAGWWDERRGFFHSLRLHDGSFAGDSTPESQVFPLLCGLIQDGPRIDATVKEMISAPRPDVEARSYFSAAWYMYGWNEEATAELRALTSAGLPRREYPEVSFAVIGSIVGSLMGVDPDVRERVVCTLPRLPDSVAWASVEALPVFDNVISVRHDSLVQTSLENLSGPPLFWRATFPGSGGSVLVDGVRTPASSGTGPNGQPRFWAWVRVEPGSTHTAARS